MTIGVHQADTLNYLFGPIKTVSSFFNKLCITEANLLRTVARLDRRFDAERKQGPDQHTTLELFERGKAESNLTNLTLFIRLAFSRRRR